MKTRTTFAMQPADHRSGEQSAWDVGSRSEEAASNRLPFTALCLVTILGVGSLALHAADSTSNASASSAATVAKPEPGFIPKSVFEIPKTPKDGCDPFFPNSTRPFGTTIVRTNPLPTPAATLFLKALSGTSTRRLATINNVTFEAGEENEVLSGSTRVRVRVLEIKEDSVVIEVGGVRQTLRMRSGF